MDEFLVLLTNTPGVPDVVGLLFPNLPNFIAHVLATIVIVVFLAKVVYKPFRESIDKRRDKIDEVLNEAIVKQTTANRDRKDAAQLLREAKTESVEIVEKARIEADSQKADILEAANIEASNLQGYAKKSVARERAKAEGEIHEAIVNVALQAASKILEEKIDDSKDKKMIDEFIANLDKDNKDDVA
ncbi:F-type H+-transporting ATPase subunit b [Entomoplasma freundtii]|uniref:ATP synthase subunit b n=1 Tax=Entomoplasma freundtii TaxID=74700 RepID=A0A2K8NS43_9MOLU|nr:F0F1 ATP synthase subunit B [Entomoplasma freundtii]ATZ16672.1 F0F1 ATP synthase subunit B [Entomoplasma freundtii]TDY58161.1 F-type H+-transporting ATPase subunit b [Entomoplasma freundtii]